MIISDNVYFVLKMEKVTKHFHYLNKTIKMNKDNLKSNVYARLMNETCIYSCNISYGSALIGLRPAIAKYKPEEMI